MQAKGYKIINFSIGEPDFRTPDNVKRKTISAVKNNLTKYTQVAGTLELRGAIAQKLKRDNKLDYLPSEIVVSNGAKHSLYNAMLATINPGDEVIIPSPYWVTYPYQVRLCGGKPVFVETGNGFIPAADVMRKKITKRTKIIIINTPNNPTGAVYPEKALKGIADLAIENNITIISDEIYEKIIYNGRHRSIAATSRQAKEHTITINGLSKSHSMTGYRMGYAACPAHIASAMARIQSHTTSSISSITQYAAIEALNDKTNSVAKMRETFRRRRDLVVREMSDIPQLEAVRPDGAFYIFPSITKVLKKENANGTVASKSEMFAERLLERANVAVVPGAPFGSDSNIRISYAVPEESIIEGMRRIRRFLK